MHASRSIRFYRELESASETGRPVYALSHCPATYYAGNESGSRPLNLTFAPWPPRRHAGHRLGTDRIRPVLLRDLAPYRARSRIACGRTRHGGGVHAICTITARTGANVSPPRRLRCAAGGCRATAFDRGPFTSCGKSVNLLE